MARNNRYDSILRVGGPKLPRYKHDSPNSPILTSSQHGRLSLAFCYPVLPGETIPQFAKWFNRSDTFSKVPLDPIQHDIYYFYVPYRYIDSNFTKVMGDKDELDHTTYGFPTITITGLTGGTLDASCLLQKIGLNWIVDSTDGGYDDTICAYPLKAYWKIRNEFFRDENIDPLIDIDVLDNITISLDTLLEADPEGLPTSDNIKSLFFEDWSNRLTDIYSRAMIAPQYGDAYKLPGAALAPVITSSSVHDGGNESIWFTKGLNDAQSYPIGVYETGQHGTTYIGADNTAGPETAGSIKADPINLWTKQQLGTIQELSVLTALQAMEMARMRGGHRYNETLEVLYGVSMPDYILGRAEYLGGRSTYLDTMPVLSTQASSLGEMSGNGATLFTDGGFMKTFPEAGLVLCLYCDRVHHKFTQGKQHYLEYRGLLDIPNGYTANLGPTGLKQNELANVGSKNASVIFGYQLSFIHERLFPSYTSGLWSPCTSDEVIIEGGEGEEDSTINIYQEFRKLWSHADYYDKDFLPELSKEWLKENPSNVDRTMSGRLIPKDTGSGSTQHYLFEIYICGSRTNFLPPNPDPLWYIRRA